MKNFKYAKNFLARLAPLDNEAGTKLPLDKVFPFILTSILHTKEGGHTGPTISANLKSVLTRLGREDAFKKLHSLGMAVESKFDTMDRFLFVITHLPLMKNEASLKVMNEFGGEKQWRILLAVYYT